MTLKQFLEQAFEPGDDSQFMQNTLIEARLGEGTTVRYYGTLIARIDHKTKQARFYNANYSISTRRRIEILRKIARDKKY